MSIPLKTLVVIPSIRTITLDYIGQLFGPGLDLLVIDDADGAVRYRAEEAMESIPAWEVEDTGYLLGSKLFHYDRTAIEQFLRARRWEELLPLIPQKNPSCKNFGLLFAWVHDYDRIILLDDDCDTRITPRFLDEIPVGRAWDHTTWPTHALVTESGWVNPTALLDSAPFYSRGYPYEFRGEVQRMVAAVKDPFEIVFNEGLWAGTPDINGIDKVHHTRQQPPPDVAVTDPDRRLVHKGKSFVLRHHARLPLSIMNVQLSTALVPTFWQPPDYPLPGGWRIRRHDDVWSSLVLGHVMPKQFVRTVGGPIIWHRKAGDEIAELLSEHPTNLAQGYLEDVLQQDSETRMRSVRQLAEVGLKHLGAAPNNQLAAAVVRYLLDAARWEAALSRITRGAALT